MARATNRRGIFVMLGQAFVILLALVAATAEAAPQTSPVFGGDSLWVQLLPFALIAIIGIIPSLHLFRKLGMSRAWALFAFLPLTGLLAIIYTAAYGRVAGIIAIVLCVVLTLMPLLMLVMA
jgi:hypothetical protein